MEGGGGGGGRGGNLIADNVSEGKRMDEKKKERDII